jgi:hypothetical protein
MLRTFFLGAAVLAVLTACDAPAPAADATLEIQALAGPTCPVETDPPDPNCAPRPVAEAPIVVTQADGGQVVAQGVTDGEGRLTLAVPAGDLVVTAGAVEGLMAAPAPMTASVAAGETSEVELLYDTGIR